MDCHRVRRALAAYGEEALSPDEREDIRLHLAGCRNCASLPRQFSGVRAALQALPALIPPRQLIASLRVLASHERVRKLSGARLPEFMAGPLRLARLRASDMMRPVALPLAGGLLSALVLFAILAPNFALHQTTGLADVPTVLSTEATFLGMGPFGFSGDMVTVDVTVNSQGRVVDYSTPSGQAWMEDPHARRSVENALLFTQFSPATTFGQPASTARVRLTLRRSWIDIKG